MSTLRAGARLGPYEIVGVIGTGGMGEVYRAWDPRLQRDVAIKLLPATYSGDAERLRRFELEVRAAGQLAHPNIPAIYDIGTFKGSPYVVSELLDGETLRQRLRHGKSLVPRKATEIGLQIARGLSAVKEMGLVHRDLKPENIFLTKDGQVKILDFGLAKLVQPEAKKRGTEPPVVTLTQEGLIVGTAGYMSPEQVRGDKVDHRSDIFAFGLIFYEMLAGKRAFWRDSQVETLHAILDDEPPDLLEVNRSCPPAMARIVRHCLEKNPEQRFQSARDVAIALDDTLTAMSSTAVTPPTPLAALPRRLHVPVPVPVLRRVGASAGLLALGLIGGLLIGRVLGKVAPPRFEQLTFQRGMIWSARYAPDGQTVVFGGGWEGKPVQMFSTKPGIPVARSLGPPGSDILAISRGGEMAVALGRTSRSVWVQTGTLAHAPLAGGQPRPLLEGVEWADWSPDGADLAVVRYEEGQDRLEYPVGQLLYSTAGWIGHPRVSPRGDVVAFFDHPVFTDDGGSLSVVDRKGRVRVLVKGLKSAQGLAWSTDGSEVWFSASDTGADRNLRAVSLRGRQRLLAVAPAELTLQDVAADGHVLFVRETWRAGMVALAPGEASVRDLSWLDYSLVRDMSGDGRTVLFIEGGRGGGSDYGVYLRRTDGSPAVRLGDGDAAALSPDGRWAITLPNETPRQLILQPTGAGEPRPVTSDAINHLRARFFPDGWRIAFAGHEPGRGVQLFVQDVSAGTPKPITPEGAGLEFAISPDGKYVAGIDSEQRIWIYPVEATEPRVLADLTPGLVPIRWSADGGKLYVCRPTDVPGRIFAYDFGTGRTELVREIELPDPAGFVRFNGVFVSSDATAYACSYLQLLSELFEAQGLK
jgi:Tol biopolymer transport system component